MPQSKQGVPLVPHPSTPSAAARAIAVRVHRERQRLALRYVVACDLGRMRVPAPRRPAPADGLWRHTCFELFVARPGSTGYEELNFSPSGEWAAYRFSGYRQGGVPLDCPQPAIHVRAGDGALQLEAAIACPPEGALKIGLSVVLEDADGALSYWALRHPSAQPDFHHADGFALEIDEARH
jgi:hypothetical protein